MSIADYSDLAVTVSEYTGRDDFMQMFPRFVSFAENKLNRVLRVGNMEAVETITTGSNGHYNLDNLPEPANPRYSGASVFLEMRMVTDTTGRVLEALAPQAANSRYGPYSGTPVAYYIKDSTFITTPYAAATDFEINYYQRIPPISADTSYKSNWLLNSSPMIYLYAVSVEVMSWALASGKEPDPQRLALFRAALKEETDALQAQDSNERYSNSKVMSRGVNP